LFARPLVNEDFDPWDSAAFLEALLTELTGRVVVVGDGGSRHKRDPIRQLEEVWADRLTWEKFPPSPPMLCPVEPVWSWLKSSQLCNYAPHDAIELNGRGVAELTAIQDNQKRYRFTGSV
jgi:hypothetical protein